MTDYRNELVRLTDSKDLHPVDVSKRDLCVMMPVMDVTYMQPPTLEEVAHTLDSGVLLGMLDFYCDLMDAFTATDIVVANPTVVSELRDLADVCVLELRYREQWQPEHDVATVLPFNAALGRV